MPQLNGFSEPFLDISISPNLSKRIKDLALLLGTSSYLDNIVELKAAGENPKQAVFGFSYSSAFDELLRDIGNATKNELNDKVYKATGKYTGRKPGMEPGMEDESLQNIMMCPAEIMIPEDVVCIFVHMPVSERTYQDIIRRVQRIRPDIYIDANTPMDPELRFQTSEAKFNTSFSSQIKIGLPLTTVETWPRLIPFFVIPLYLCEGEKLQKRSITSTSE